MRRTWQVFFFEYWHNVKRPGYLLFTFIFPIFIVVAPVVFGAILALAIRAALPEPDPRPVGVLDQVGITGPDLTLPGEPIELRRLPSLEAARLALAEESIQAYINLPDHYWETGQIELYYQDVPNVLIQTSIQAWMSTLVRSQLPPEILEKYDRGAVIIQQGPTPEETFSSQNMVEWGIIFVIIYFTQQANLFTAVRIFDSITSEAENRTIEILLTSVTPLQFLLGKLAGLTATGLTQLGVWTGSVFILAFMAGLFFDYNLVTIILAWEHLWFLLSILLGAHLTYQILAAAFGFLRVSGGLGAQLLNGLGLSTGIALIYVMYFVPRSPDAPLALALSFFPMTTAIVLPIRVVTSNVPDWQVWLAQGLLWGTNSLGIIWLRYLLKANLIKYGRRPRLLTWLKTTLSERLPLRRRKSRV